MMRRFLFASGGNTAINLGEPCFYQGPPRRLGREMFLRFGKGAESMINYGGK